MIGKRRLDRKMIVTGSAAAGIALLTAAVFLLPNQTLVADAISRATPKTPPAPLAAVPMPEARVLAVLWEHFKQDKPLTVLELQQLLANGATFADANVLSALADRLEAAGEPSPTMATTYNVMASGRHAVALGFLNQRPDRNGAALWRLRFELNRSNGNASGAQAMLLAAARNPGAAPPKDIVEGAFALHATDAILVAAEHGAIPRLDRAMSLDLARHAAGSGRYDLIGRIDRAGSSDWRVEDPWLAMNMAQRSGDTQAALRYAALLPAGQAQGAQDAVLLASGDRNAVRAMLLERARGRPQDRPVIAQQLLELGFRAEALELLRGEAATRSPQDPIAARLLYLMGPRPDAAGLTWLRARGEQDAAWLRVYTERENPRTMLSYLESANSRATTETLLLRLKLAGIVRDRQAGTRALDKLLDGRTLSAQQLSAVSASLQPGLPDRLVLALSRARTGAGVALPSDRMDLAWAAWNRKDYRDASEQVQAHLRSDPGNLDALRLMANIAGKLQGERAARTWLERALAQTPRLSRLRIELLEQLDRKKEAVALVEELRTQSPGDRNLAVIHARLLIANGQPGRAQQVLQP